MSIKQHFELMATYNQWMNAKLYEASSRLDNDALIADRGAFFGSVFATLNHVMVADTIWLKRFADHPAHFPALAPVHTLPFPRSLGQPLYVDFAPLWDARTDMDNLIIRFVSETEAAHFDQPLHYLNTQGEKFARPFGPLLQHFFNHQTHHRGQITTLLSQSGIDVGVTDLSALIGDWQAP